MHFSVTLPACKEVTSLKNCITHPIHLLVRTWWSWHKTQDSNLWRQWEISIHLPEARQRLRTLPSVRAEDCVSIFIMAWRGSGGALLVPVWFLLAAVAEGLPMAVLGFLQPPRQKSPTVLWNDTVWEGTSGVLLHTKSRPWQVCKTEISEWFRQLIYVAVVYAKKWVLKWGLEWFALGFKSPSLDSCHMCAATMEQPTRIFWDVSSPCRKVVLQILLWRQECSWFLPKARSLHYALQGPGRNCKGTEIFWGRIPVMRSFQKRNNVFTGWAGHSQAIPQSHSQFHSLMPPQLFCVFCGGRSIFVVV